MVLFLGIIFNPAFAEVTSIQTNENLFYKGDDIEFSGSVERDSTGLVTIVIRDINDEFVLLTQATINHDDTFEKSVKIENRFTEHGTYSATGFILNMTRGVTSEFDVSLNGIPIHHEDKINIEKDQDISNSDIIIDDDKIIEEPGDILKSSKADFVDSSKDPSYYLQRYYSEPAYKSWFDRNYPDMTIEEAAGHTDSAGEMKSTVQNIIDKNIIPEAQASSTTEHPQDITDNSDIAQITLAIAGLGILFGAVYGVKRQVDTNSRQISLNRNTIRNRIINPIRGSNPKTIIQTRLAKGEITLEEYEMLKSKLN